MGGLGWEWGSPALVPDKYFSNWKQIKKYGMQHQQLPWCYDHY